MHFSKKDLDDMFFALDADGNGFIDKDEFVDGTLRISDDVSPLSIMELHTFMVQLLATSRRMEAQLAAIAEVASATHEALTINGQTAEKANAEALNTPSHLRPSSRPLQPFSRGRFTSLPTARSMFSSPRPEPYMPLWKKLHDDLAAMVSQIEASNADAFRDTASTVKLPPIKREWDEEFSSMMSRIEKSHTDTLEHLRELWKRESGGKVEQVDQQPDAAHDPSEPSSLADVFAGATWTSASSPDGQVAAREGSCEPCPSVQPGMGDVVADADLV